MIAFQLSMPGVNSWNGRWSGEGRSYVKVVTLGRGASAIAHEVALVAGSPYRYDFGDGWTASVSVRAIDAREARSLRKQSAGFAGSDWMVDELLVVGRIRTFEERYVA